MSDTLPGSKAALEEEFYRLRDEYMTMPMGWAWSKKRRALNAKREEALRAGRRAFGPMWALKQSMIDYIQEFPS